MIVETDGIDGEKLINVFFVIINFGLWPTVLKLFIATPKTGTIKNKLSSQLEAIKSEIGENINVLKINMRLE